MEILDKATKGVRRFGARFIYWNDVLIVTT
jgi:hypothetical protein